MYRICRAPFRQLDGEGARLYGGRWNSPGRPAVYASETLALAALEYLLHLDPATAPDDLVALTVQVPEDAVIEDVDRDGLERGWDRQLECARCRALGDAWLRAARSLVLRVPAAPMPEEHNFLLNPRHPAMSHVRVTSERPFTFDPRLA